MIRISEQRKPMTEVTVVPARDDNDCPEQKRCILLHSANRCTPVEYREVVILMLEITIGHQQISR